MTGTPAANIPVPPNPGAIIASNAPGDINGSAQVPTNTPNIMQSMFAEMVTPEQIAANKAPNQPINLNQPNKQPVEVQPNVELNLFAEEPVETPPETPSAEEAEVDMSDIPDDPNTENWKKARKALKESREKERQLAKEAADKAARLEKYEKGEIVPEIIAAKDLRIQQLEPYETVVQGRLSDEYQTLVAEPIKKDTEALNKLAKDYNVPENIKDALVKKIVETDNEAERNSLISKYFPDALGASKVESLVRSLHEKGQIALEMENKPKEVFQTLQAQYAAKKEEENRTIASQFESVSKVSWTKALEKTAGEGLFPELILDPSNSEISAIAEKNQHRAGIQYGALVKQLRENGLKTLPENLAIGLARSVQLSIGGVGLAKQLKAAQARIAELEGTSGVIATYLRPGVNNNGGGRAPVVTNDKGPANPKDAGAMAAQIFSRK